MAKECHQSHRFLRDTTIPVFEKHSSFVGLLSNALHQQCRQEEKFGIFCIRS